MKNVWIPLLPLHYYRNSISPTWTYEENSKISAEAEHQKRINESCVIFLIEMRKSQCFGVENSRAILCFYPFSTAA